MKAKEIIDKWENLLGHSDLNVCYTGDLEEETKETAKQCALLEVKSIIKLLEKHCSGRPSALDVELSNYKQLKQDIKNF